MRDLIQMFGSCVQHTDDQYKGFIFIIWEEKPRKSQTPVVALLVTHSQPSIIQIQDSQSEVGVSMCHPSKLSRSWMWWLDILWHADPDTLDKWGECSCSLKCRIFLRFPRSITYFQQCLLWLPVKLKHSAVLNQASVWAGRRGQQVMKDMIHSCPGYHRHSFNY